MDWPGIPSPNCLPLHIGTFSRYSALWDLGAHVGGNIGGGAALTWATANLDYYIPVWLPYPYPVRRVWWVNNSSTTNNIAFGVYSYDGAQIYSTGSTARSGASTRQYVTPTEFILEPGRYFFMVALNGTTASSLSGGSTGTAAQMRMVGIMQGAGTFPAGATAAFATIAAANPPMPQCGICRIATGF